MKIAVPTAATAGTRIAMLPRKIAATPTSISARQLFLRSSRTAGSSEAPPISMEEEASPGRGRSPVPRRRLDLAVAGIDDRIEREAGEAGGDGREQRGAVGSVLEFAQSAVEA